ncbi:MAG: PH domain-containing protein [Chloroflexota bacterium]|jgi:membrane protein YdbS with pleckstrin-like domain
MNEKVFEPSSRYLAKIRLQTSIILFLIYLGCAPLALAFGANNPDGDVWYLAISAGVILICWLVGMALTGPYYRSLRYEVMADEVIVRAGIVTTSVKHVPYRTVTNITVRRGLMDRWLFGLGTLNIQTAGMSGTTGAEESLVGLPDVQAVYDIVVTELRRFRGSQAPTAADDDVPAPAAMADGQLTQLLVEVRAIRQILEQND